MSTNNSTQTNPSDEPFIRYGTDRTFRSRDPFESAYSFELVTDREVSADPFLRSPTNCRLALLKRTDDDHIARELVSIEVPWSLASRIQSVLDRFDA